MENMYHNGLAATLEISINLMVWWIHRNNYGSPTAERFILPTIDRALEYWLYRADKEPQP